MAQLIEDMMPRIFQKMTPPPAPATRKLYTLAAKKLQFVFAEFAPHEIRPKHVAQFQREMAATPVMTNRCLSILKRVMSLAVVDELIDKNPCTDIDRHPPTKRTRRITDRELAAIKREGSDRLRIVLDLAYLTGQRISDVLHIRRADCLDDGIYFEPIKTRTTTATKLLIEWTPELRAAVAAAKKAHGRVVSQWLIPGRAGRPLAYQPVWRDWRAACVAAGVRGATIHDVRAMAASDAKRQGLDPQALLGHSSERMTEKYLRDRDVRVVRGPTGAK